MAKLVRCVDCGTNISARAKACPGCGAPTGKADDERSLLIILAATVLVSLLFFFHAPTRDEFMRINRNAFAGIRSLFVHD
jgi:hypothetical protein